VIYAFLISLGVGGLSSGILAALWKAAQKLLSDERGAHAVTRANLGMAQTALELVEAARKDDKSRLEAVIAAKLVEIKELEADTYACNSPAVVRERLRKLLVSPPAPAASSGGAVAVLVPPTSKP